MSFLMFIHLQVKAKSDGAHSISLTVLVNEIAAGAPRPGQRSC